MQPLRCSGGDTDGKPERYLPHLMRIAAITQEAPGVRTFRLEFVDDAARDGFSFKTGPYGNIFPIENWKGRKSRCNWPRKAWSAPGSRKNTR
jgi:hypothetical protein